MLTQEEHIMRANIRGVLAAVVLTTAPPSAFANVITDWDEKAVITVTPMAALNGTSPYTAIRLLAIVHTAMFDTVNSIERRYQPYLVQLPADPTTSKDAAAAAAAATVLATIDEKTAGDMKRALAAYLASIPDGAAKSDGIKLGESIAFKLLEARAQDGASAPDAYRPRTLPGVYVPTAITLSSMWPDMKPFAMTTGSQFRPPLRSRWPARNGPETTTRSRTMADTAARSEPACKPRPPGSGSTR
jgi:hypothetical protein